jgi:hypothetical protein
MNPKKKYKFQATYKDGSTYTKNDEDVSIQDPLRSCFYDVKQDELRTFFLFNDDVTYSVNLEDGHFEVNGVPFFMHADKFLKNYRLIYYIVTQEHITLSKDKEEHVTGDVVFQLGWQANDSTGKNIQRVMEIY